MMSESKKKTEIGDQGKTPKELENEKVQRHFNGLWRWVCNDTKSMITVPCDQSTVEKVTHLLLRLRSRLFTTRLIGTIPKDVLRWIEQGRENFRNDKKLQEGLDSLEYQVYFQFFPNHLFDEVLSKAMKDKPINIEDRYRKALIELRKIIPKNLLTVPIGKCLAKGRQKRDDLSKKNWPIVKEAVLAIYDLLKPIYPIPQVKTKGRGKEKGPGLYSSPLAKDIAMLMRTFVGLSDFVEKDVYSRIGYAKRFKKEGGE